MGFLSRFLNYAIMLGLIFVGGIIYFSMTHTSVQKKDKSLAIDQNPEDLANKYLQEANRKLNSDRYKTQTMLSTSASNLQTLDEHQKIVETNPQKVPVDRQIAKDFSNEIDRNKSLEQKFQEELIAAQNQHRQTEIEKMEYIKQFKANARKNGYEIVVDDNLQVISIEPIRKPTNDIDVRALESNDF